LVAIGSLSSGSFGDWSIRFPSLTVQAFPHRALCCGQVFPLHSSSSTNAISRIFRLETELPIMTALALSKEGRGGSTFQPLASCGASRYCEARDITAMATPVSFDATELELLIGIVCVVAFIALFLALSVSAIVRRALRDTLP
jgi:hypothetical protein